LLSSGHDGPSGTDGSIDTLLTLSNLVVKLMPCDGREHIVPPLTLYAAVDAELLRAGDHTLLHRAHVEYWSADRMPFTAWGANQADRLVRALADSERSLAEQIVQRLFLAAASPESPSQKCLMPY
jgi:hypothetical protein